MSVYSTPVKIDGDCIYDFPAPYRVLTDRSLSGHNNMTIEYCADFCSGMEISIRYCLGCPNRDKSQCPPGTLVILESSDTVGMVTLQFESGTLRREVSQDARLR